MKGRWAAGIVPRNFSWIVQDRLAVSERPGGYAPAHRPVRRQEEILWIAAQGFTRVVSLLPSTHNLRAYEEHNLPYAHFPLTSNEDAREILGLLYPAILGWMRKGDRLLLHQEELGERVAGVMAGFLFWSGMFAEPPQAISAMEQLLRKELGSAGRIIVAQSIDLPPPVDEYGVPLPRRASIQATMMGAPGATKKFLTKEEAAAQAAKGSASISAIRPAAKSAGSAEPAKKKPSASAAKKKAESTSDGSKESN